ncbi:hypothetical protein [Cellulomonas carbonis]|uniref:Uncharacterized protein n=1 Tax=Cellulomonas carbonis T26 TaxID=947969 RepID=A0A0A0BQ00_9CELL|nr:hypothetical protein [Cellulomonas carbonis]KGM10563.1 hypothetical protein N868_13455 [Cellulomonas carbonis T26]MDT0166937.1 hypothetical protein [Actinotalea sp. AC32]GGC02143.1 hypothetical protein GCM10010972_13870 [Cellulomonas carbonis]
MTTLDAGPAHERATSVVLHGLHPLDGHEVTWKVTPLPQDRRGHVTFLVQRAEGHVDGEQAWSCTDKETFVLSGEGVRELVRRVSSTSRIGSSR